MEWAVNQSGHEILDEKIPKNLTGRSRVIAELARSRKIVPKGTQWRKYNPFFQNPGIAREFSKLPLKADNEEIDHTAAIRFANKYGLLGLSRSDGREPEDIQHWSDMIARFDEIFFLIDQGLNDAACKVFNEYGPEPRLKLLVTKASMKRDRFFEIRPTTLYGAMWIMVANELSRGTQLQHCQMPGCEIWVQKRVNQRFCSSKCRQAAYRRGI